MAVKYKIVRKTMKKNAQNDKPAENSKFKNSELGLSAENSEKISSGEINNPLSHISDHGNNERERVELKSDMDDLERKKDLSESSDDSKHTSNFGNKLKAFLFGSDKEDEEEDEDMEDEVTISLTRDFPIIPKNGDTEEKDDMLKIKKQSESGEGLKKSEPFANKEKESSPF